MEVVAANEDLLIQILLFLPLKPLLRFKTVSKAWLSLISSSWFRLLKSKRFRKDVSGLIPRHHSRRLDRDFFPLDGGRNPPLDYVAGEKGRLIIEQSCNGLFLCKGDDEERRYVINPTTKEHTLFSGNDYGVDCKLWAAYIAFDPRKSIHFKLIRIYDWPETEDVGDETWELWIYSSETGLMTRLDSTFDHPILVEGVYWNDAINWIDAKHDGSYFNVIEERFGKFPMPPLPRIEGYDEEKYGRWIRYFGESNDHLYLICFESNPATQFQVYEMDRAYSGWSLRFCVDLQPVFGYEAIDPQLPPSCFHYYPYFCNGYTFEILGIVEKDDDEELFLVLTIHGKAIRFNLKDSSFSKVCNYATEDARMSIGYPCSVVQFMESLHPL